VTLTATVSAVAPGSGKPTGSVTFMDGSTVLGTANLNNGTASISTSGLSVGSHSITAVYNGNPNFTASTSAVLTQVVNNHDSLLGGPETLYLDWRAVCPRLRPEKTWLPR
jgi:hypothetical protein